MIRWILNWIEHGLWRQPLDITAGQTVFDADITMLDPDKSTFNTLLMKVAGTYMPRTTVALCHGMYVGAIWRDRTGRAWVVDRIRYKRPDDWFSDEKVADCSQPWHKGERRGLSVEWLEDEFMPGLSRA